MVLRDCGAGETLLPFKVTTDSELARLQRVCTQLVKSQSAAVSTQALRGVLTAAEFSSYSSNLSAPTSLLDAIRADGKPSEIVRYADMLRKADWTNTRAEAASRRFTTRRYGTSGISQAAHLHRQAQAQYERACEYLDEQLTVASAHTANAIRAWLDRDFDISTAGSIAPDCMGVARAVDSHSKHCQSQRSNWKMVQQQHRCSCQHAALVDAVQALLYQLHSQHSAEPQVSPRLARLLTLQDDY